MNTNDTVPAALNGMTSAASASIMRKRAEREVREQREANLRNRRPAAHRINDYDERRYTLCAADFDNC